MLPGGNNRVFVRDAIPLELSFPDPRALSLFPKDLPACYIQLAVKMYYRKISVSRLT